MSTNCSVSYRAYRRPFVRDLAFAIACPPALTHWVDHHPLLNSPSVTIHSASFWQQQLKAYTPRLLELDTTTAYQQITKFLMNRPSPYRLGFHFEGLLHFWLQDGFERNHHPFEVLAHNVQLFRGKQTTGELDYILRNHATGLIEHWELAIKFFVGTAPYHFNDWVGLNSRDNLELKMTHMQSRQFKAVWVDVDIEGNSQKVKIDKRVGVIKGRFFKPIHDTQFARPDWLPPTFPLHNWIDDTDTHRLKRLQQDLPPLDPFAMPQIRRAHYVEWFTKRDFYDNFYQRLQKSSLTIHAKPQLWSPTSPPKMGLYFHDDKPFVIYYPNRDTNQDKF